MYLILFRSSLTDEAGDDYQKMAQEMLDLAEGQPGFVDFTQYTSEEGERLAVIRWEDEASLKAWRSHARHQVAQKLGRERWYGRYHLEVAEIVRESRFSRD